MGGGGAHRRDTTADVGTQSGAQGRALKADGRRVRETSRWTALRTGRGGGERVQEKGATTSNDTDGGGAVVQRWKEKIQKIGGYRWGGRVRIIMYN